MLDAPALVDPELGQDETCFAKAAGAVAECRPDARVAEADDVSAAGVGEARNEPRMLVHAPALVEAEVGEHELRLLKRPVAVAERDPDARIPEADDVGVTAACQHGDEAWMPVHAPSLLGAEVREDEPRFLEAAVAVAQRGPYPRVPEADEIGAAVTGEVDGEARVAVDPPAAGLDPEVRHDDPRRLEAAVAVAECRPDAALAEADDVGRTAAPQPREYARVAVDAPAGRSGDVDDAPAADRAGHVEAGGGRLRPRELVEGSARVTRCPEVRVRADIHRLAVRRACD